jgi:hypothetical protein
VAYERSLTLRGAGRYQGLVRESSVLPVPDAPNFADVADTPGMTAMALFAWVSTSHPTMPDIVLPPEDLRNVVAYILSLQTQQ